MAAPTNMAERPTSFHSARPPVALVFVQQLQQPPAVQVIIVLVVSQA